MEQSTTEFKPNSITNEFIGAVDNLLKNNRLDDKDIIDKLQWNKSTFSLVKNGKRNIPIEKWELFKEVFKYENNLKTENNGTTVIPASKYIEMLEKHYEDMKATKDDLLQTKNELMSQQSALLQAHKTVTERNSLFEKTFATLERMLQELQSIKTNSTEQFEVIEDIGKTVIENQHRALSQMGEQPYPLPSKKGAAASAKAVHKEDSK